MSAKDIVLKPIDRKDADRIVKQNHYSGKVVPNSQIHIGIFYSGKLEGAMQYGPSMDKRKVMGLVSDTKWNGFLELNRMAFSEALPRNSESRALSIAFKLIKKHYPHIEWIISFADGTQCGDGTIYRASGFVLTSIKKNTTMLLMPDGSIVADKTLNNPNNMGKNGRKGSSIAKEQGAKPVQGFQLRYVYFLNPKAKERLTVPIIPFSKIDEMGASMYKGISIKRGTKAISSDQLESGGAIPTATLQSLGEPNGSHT